MNTLKTGFLLIVTVLTLLACSGNSLYGDPDAQRDRSKQAQDEMRRDTK
ncbi:MAG: hypothetical protein OEY66_03515 [Gammaproteobacteria bacterium]|nr:hypothetical protein [Gammaproteobacteria bacterium]